LWSISSTTPVQITCANLMYLWAGFKYTCKIYVEKIKKFTCNLSAIYLQLLLVSSRQNLCSLGCMWGVCDQNCPK